MKNFKWKKLENVTLATNKHKLLLVEVLKLLKVKKKKFKLEKYKKTSFIEI